MTSEQKMIHILSRKSVDELKSLISELSKNSSESASA